MPMLYFMFAHLVGDFVLQPNELMRWKFEHWRGIFFHSMIHFLVNLLVFFPFLPDLRVFLLILGISTAHFFIDYAKVKAEKTGRLFRLYFALDQLAHFLLMAAAALAMTGFEPHFFKTGFFSIVYGDAYILAGLSLLIFFTSFLEIWFFQRERERHPGAAFKPDFDSMLKRGALYMAAFGAFMIFGAYGVAAMG